jgi:hypothetical protein
MKLALCLGLGLSATPLRAHDTWFELRAAANPPALWLGTGDRFPVLESRIAVEHLQRQACAPQADLALRGTAAARPMAPVSGPAGRLHQALALRLPAAAADAATGAPHTCWASLVPFDIEIEPAKVALYLKEIGAAPALHAAWATEQAAGRPWRERYVKHARVEVGAISGQPVGMALEALLLGAANPRVGEALRFQLLWGGKPLADQPVELVSEQSRFGLWRRTDAQGQLSQALPLEGRWMLRSTHLRPPALAGERWQSDFVTLAFDVAPAR